MPPIPDKKTFNNAEAEFVEERCFFLNMFFKQLVRCPYLFDSEELKIFIRPPNDVERNLTLLPKPNNQRILDRILPFYSIMGDIDAHAL